jgi:hypothetical protein
MRQRQEIQKLLRAGRLNGKDVPLDSLIQFLSESFVIGSKQS